MTVALAVIAKHGALLSFAASTLIMGALRLNPRLFLRHFPAAVRASQAPLSASEQNAGRLVGFLLLVLFVGVPVWSARTALDIYAYGRLEVFLHAFLVGMVFNLVDWLVLDELWLGLGRPRWALPPGVTMDEVPFEHGRHARGFLSGTFIFLLVGLVAAVVL